MGIKEQTIFVEVDIDKISQTLGMDITFVTSAKTDEDGRALLEALGLPFRKQEVR
jgi:large subunit ribosomal protein L5